MLIIIALSLGPVATGRAREDGSGPLAFRRVNVVDTVSGSIRPNVTVVVDKGRIVQVDNSDAVVVPEGAEVIEGAGKYLMPGLWDMHTHWYETEYLPVFIANGVTGIRLMSASPIHFRWMQDTLAGKLIGPRILEASLIIDGPDPMWPGSIIVTNREQAYKAVYDARSGGVDFIKVYSGLSRKAYFAIADECKAQDIPFAGHVPYVLSTSEASDAGQMSIEHLLAIVRGCSKGEQRVGQMLLEDRRSYDKAFKAGLDGYDPIKAKGLYDRLLHNNTWLCLTIVLSRARFLIDTGQISEDPRLAYVPPFLRQQWASSRAGLIRQRSQQGWSSGEEVYEGILRFVGSLRKAGLAKQMLAGTDTGNPYCIPGFSLHDELELLVESGFTPAEALRTCTYNAARFMEAEESLGTVERGKLADLVLLEANPLEDIRNTTRIAGVMVNGKFCAEYALKQMLAEIKSIAEN